MEEDEELNINFGKIKGFFGKKKKEEPKEPEKKEEAPSEPQKPAEEKVPEPEKKEEPQKDEAKPFQAEEEGIDVKKAFSGIKGIFKKGEKEEQEEELSVNLEGVSKFAKKYSTVLVLVLLIVASVGISVFMRMQPASLPYTENWAENSVYNMITNDIQSSVNSQYPNLPEQQKNALISEELTKALNEDIYTFKTGQYAGQQMSIRQQLDSTTEYFKDFYRDNESQPYMPDIDPYYWQRYTENILDHGYMGDEIRDGIQWDNHMLAPNGRAIVEVDRFHPHFLANYYKILAVFFSSITLRQAMMTYPVLVSALTVLLIFLIGRRISGNAGGFFAATMAAVNVAFLSRTTYGRADTDAWVIFFSMLVTWAFLESFAAKSRKVRIGFGVAAGFFLGIYSTAWGGWWYILYFLLAAAAAYIAYNMLTHREELKQGFLKYLGHSAIKNAAVTIVIFFLSTAVFVSVLTSVNAFTTSLGSFVGVTQLKTPVAENLWPNVLTTVAELNEGSINDIINSVGGKLLFFIALIGIALTAMRTKKQGMPDMILVGGSFLWWLVLIIAFPQDPLTFLSLMIAPIGIWILWGIIKEERDINIRYAALLLVLFAGTVYASTKGIRFNLLLVPAFSIAFGAALGIIFYRTKDWLAKALSLPATITGITVFLVLGMLMFAPVNLFQNSYNAARQDVPLISDAWWDSLKAIQADSNEDAIITSWWDFGHHFKEIADRPVTFDGTTQQLPQAHWVGRLFMEDDEELAVGILRMLDCGGNNAFDVIYGENEDTIKSVDILYEILPMTREEAEEALDEYGVEDVEGVLQYTHCQPPEAYVIASEDMISKSGVWAHFGSWDFRRADILKNTRGMDIDESVAYINERYNYTDARAKQIYFEIQGLATERDENTWVSPWPSYASSPAGCSVSGNIVQCGDGLIVDLDTYEAWFQTEQGNVHPKSLIYADAEKVREKIFANNTIDQDLSAILIPVGTGYQSVLANQAVANGMFTNLFFMQGHGLEHFKLLSQKRSIINQNIYVWKVDWEGGEKNVMNEMIVKEFVSKGDSVEVNYIGYLDDGRVFDSSITDWQSLNITPDSDFEEEYSYNPLPFVVGQYSVISGFEEGILGMKAGEEKTIEVPPEKAYGSVEGHPLQNETLYFKVRVESIR
ncbi:FKBP-type peptidyl-prolyl cis-trans isomerase [Candidatus Woesearchaeota archaeon]|nr:FKBP-type peptidyl-prolyl cis-trans isomerase [Candidatus Woesearchaeota archaeon]